MSRVKVSIDDVTWGLNISPEHTIDLIQALNAVAIESRRDARSAKASAKRNEARTAFENIVSAISFDAKKTA